MALELLVLTLDDIVSWHGGQHGDRLDCTRPERADASDDRHAVAQAKALADTFTRYRHEAHLAGSESARAQAEAHMFDCEQSFIAACAVGNFDIQRWAMAWMEDADRTGGRLALASMLSSRMVCATMERALGQDWADRFSIVATADAIPVHEAEDEQYRLILRTTAIPAHQALLVTASAHCEEIARGIGMQAVQLGAQANLTVSSRDIDASWMKIDVPKHSRTAGMTETAVG